MLAKLKNVASAASRFRAADREWLIASAGDVEELWEAMAENDFADERVPYWTEVWPAAIALANWLPSRRAELWGRVCLDLGCGLGLTALTGQSLGARVLATDYEFDALKYCLLNAKLNETPPPAPVVMDWRSPALRPGIISRVWAADIIYERRFFEPIALLLNRVLPNDGLCWIAEPGRSIFKEFLSLSPKFGLRAEAVGGARVKTGASQEVEITVWEIRKTAGNLTNRLEGRNY